ncbi:MAG: hypothetical protein ACREHC_06945 [Candidatus Levyibacteriota bacterium]
MNEGINLLDPGKKNKKSTTMLRLEGMRLFASSLLFIVSAASIILFILVAISPLPALQKQEHSLELNLSNSKEDIARLAYVNERTTSINEVISKRQSLDQTLKLLQTKLPSDAKVTALKADKNVLTVTVQSKSLQSLDVFLNGVVSFVQAKNAFSQVTLNELASDEVDNVFSMTLNLVLL